MTQLLIENLSQPIIMCFPQFAIHIRQQLPLVNKKTRQVWQICQVLIILMIPKIFSLAFCYLQTSHNEKKDIAWKHFNSLIPITKFQVQNASLWQSVSPKGLFSWFYDFHIWNAHGIKKKTVRYLPELFL